MLIDRFPSLLERKKCTRCNQYFLPRNRRHDLCNYCFTDKIGSTSNRVYTARVLELRQKIDCQSHLTISCCEKCHLPFIISIYESNRKKFCDDCINIKQREKNIRSTRKYRKKLIKDKENKCERCSYDNINALEIHHKDYNHSYNTYENLEVLCANCHTIEHKNYVRVVA